MWIIALSNRHGDSAAHDDVYATCFYNGVATPHGRTAVDEDGATADGDSSADMRMRAGHERAGMPIETGPPRRAAFD
jgi:hypothetical protein